MKAIRLSGWVLLLVSASRMFAQTTEEWKYDDGVGYAPFAFSTNDTLAVVFDGRANIQLDSIRIAFKDQGTASLGIWRYSGVVRPSPMANPLILSVDVPVSSGNTIPTAEGSIQWTTLDVSAMGLDAGTAFVVGVVMGADPSVPGVLTAKVHTNNQPDHSYTFFTASVSQDWSFPTDTGGYVWQFMIRAYGHGAVTGIAEHAADIPVSATMLSNFPNPFNPSTRIRFVLSARSEVELSVFDIAGRRVASLKRGMHESGAHEVSWDGLSEYGEHVPSAIYIARLQTDRGVVMRKMLLVK